MEQSHKNLQRFFTSWTTQCPPSNVPQALKSPVVWFLLELMRGWSLDSMLIWVWSFIWWNTCLFIFNTHFPRCCLSINAWAPCSWSTVCTVLVHGSNHRMQLPVKSQGCSMWEWVLVTSTSYVLEFQSPSTWMRDVSKVWVCVILQPKKESRTIWNSRKTLKCLKPEKLQKNCNFT
jgi:hypothetical protein